jgi:S-(hydroxymethyl)glutathione dehydrogenase/alcohol dehydrogenase
VTTGFGVVLNTARLKIGESVAVYGVGGIGLNVVQAAALVSAYPIIGVDLHDAKLRLALELGATHVINASREDAVKAINAIAGTRGIDCFIDNTGLPEVIENGQRLTKSQGRLVQVGAPKNGSDIDTLPHGGEAIPQADIPRYQNLFRHGRLKLKELITHRVPLEEINTAIARMRSGLIAGRCLVEINPP